jgi:serine protease Do
MCSGLFFALSLVACAMAVSVAASPAQAAEVDAIGSPAPVGFADVIERVKPAVVGVRAKVADTAPADDSQRRPSDAPARKFGAPSPPPEKSVPDSNISLGSGFFVRGDGYVVTNNHVVANGTSFEVTTDGGKTYQAKIVGIDPQTDLALLKVSASTEFAYVRFASGLPRVGDWCSRSEIRSDWAARSRPELCRRADAISAKDPMTISFRSTHR